MKTFSPVSFNESTTEIDAKFEVGDISELDIGDSFDIDDGVVGEHYLYIPLRMSRSLFSQLQERCTVLQEAGYEDYEDWNQSNNGADIWLLVRKNLDMSMELKVYPRHYWDYIKSNSRENREPAKIFMQRIWLFDREKQDLCSMLRNYLKENGSSLEEQMEKFFSEEKMKFEKEIITTFKLFCPKGIALYDTWGNMNVFEKEYMYKKSGNREKITFPVTFFCKHLPIYLLDKTDMYKALGYKNARQMLEGLDDTPLYKFLRNCSNGIKCKEYIQAREEWVEEGKFQNDDLLKAHLTFYYENGEPTDAYIEFTFDYQQTSLRDSVKLSEKEAKDLEEALRDRFCIWAYGYIPSLFQNFHNDRYPILEFIKVKEQTGELPTIYQPTDEERKERLKSLEELKFPWER